MNFVTLETFDNYIDANLLMNRLEQAGIDCWLKDEASVPLIPGLSNAIGGIKLMIDEKDTDKSVQILHVVKEIKRRSFACPHCNSHNIQHVTTNRKAANIISAIRTLLSGKHAAGIKQVWYCFHCREAFDNPIEMDEPALFE